MARKVFFSFYYQDDYWRVNQVRQSWRFRPNSIELPFYDRAGWEQVKSQGNQAIQRWIDSKLAGSAVTVILIGQFTWSRPWVNYEIEESARQNMGIIGVHIHNLKNQQLQTSVPGINPLTRHFFNINGVQVPFARYFRTYDWVLHNGATNFGAWVEAAARQVGR